jgi:predicted dithiol-disulfide oxidoreductase (DUF899 family)
MATELTTQHKLGTREEFDEARGALLKHEKELTRRSDELARERRELPWVPVDKDYSFETEDGTKTLPELFAGRSQLMIYNFMFGPTYEAGCVACSSGVDTYDGALAHLNARDVTFTLVSRAPLERLLAYRERMGWSLPWASSLESEFNFDFGASGPDVQADEFVEGDVPPVVHQMAEASGTDVAGYLSEAPIWNVFAREDGAVYHTYTTTARGLEPLMSYYGILDRAPRGRDEEAGAPHWLRRRDEY